MAECQNTSRRALMKGVSAFGLAPMAMAAPSPAEASAAETPILRLFRQHRQTMAQFADAPDTEEAHQPLYDQADAIERRMMALPCQTPADFAAKAMVETCQGGLMPDWSEGAIWKEARLLTGMEDEGRGAPVLTGTEPGDPVPSYVAEWNKALADYEATSGDFDDDPKAREAFDRRHRFEELICSTKATTREGIVAQLEYVISEDGLGGYVTGNLWKDLDRKIFENLLAAARTLV